ncbi:DNA-directed RNA polymerase subunit alpha C-terminal domain-containing protein [Spirillospora sp. NPDC048823]|uniref:DNA-directed RNA polymerase subunit alpha C-terminal domain-containing protein n=1 Tax=unclassified Spirillospora TaxID=2642701 RepID=UPI0037134E3C
MAAEMSDTEHASHHSGITMHCPVSCLGVRTVADLVNLLATATRATIPDATTRPEPEEPQQHDEHTPRCPLSCLRLSTRVANALRHDRAEPRTIGDLVRMIQRHELSEVRNIGRRSITEIRTALIAAGFDARYSELT